MSPSHASPMPMDDPTLVRACLQRDDRAWAQLASLVRRLAAGAATSRFHLDRQAVEDVSQATLAALLADDCRILRAFQGRSSLSTYLGTIVSRTSRDYIKQRRGEEWLPPDLPTHTSFVGDANARDILSRLPERERIIFQLTLDRYTSAEIADLLTASEGRPVTAAAIRKTLERARKHLARSLRE